LTTGRVSIKMEYHWLILYRSLHNTPALRLWNVTLNSKNAVISRTRKSHRSVKDKLLSAAFSCTGHHVHAMGRWGNQRALWAEAPARDVVQSWTLASFRGIAQCPNFPYVSNRIQTTPPLPGPVWIQSWPPAKKHSAGPLQFLGPSPVQDDEPIWM
jgi:hypothetical protein